MYGVILNFHCTKTANHPPKQSKKKTDKKKSDHRRTESKDCVKLGRVLNAADRP